MCRGPLPLRCSCSHGHSPLIGLSEDDTFRTSATVGFGPDFWNSCLYDATLERRFVSLGAGDEADLTPLGASPILSPSLASCPSSLRSVYEAWKAGTLTRSMLVDVTSSDYISAFFEGSSGLSSARSSLRSLWRVSAVVATSGSSSVISLRARSLSPSHLERPLVPLRPREHGSSVVTGASSGSLSAFCVIIIFPFCPLLIVLAGTVRHRGPLRLDTGAGQRLVTGTRLDTLLNELEHTLVTDAHDTYFCAGRKLCGYTYGGARERSLGLDQKIFEGRSPLHQEILPRCARSLARSRSPY